MLPLLSSGETSATDVKGNLFWGKLFWDINGDDAVTADVTFSLADIASAEVLDDYTLQIVLTGAAAATLEGTAGYGITGGVDTIDIAAGFSVDAAGNSGFSDALSDGSLLGDMNVPAMAHPYTFAFGESQVKDNLTGTYDADHTISFDVARGDTLMFLGYSAADVSAVGGGAIAGGGGNATITVGLIGGGAQTITLDGYTSELDGTKVLFDDGSLLKTNTGAKDSLFGGVMDDLLIAGNNGDTLVGYAGNDKLIGGSGSDAIYGGEGLDIIYGRGGNDYLSGGAGVDTFYYTIAGGDDGKDVIAGFTAGAGGDVIRLLDMADAAVDAAYAGWLVQSGGDTLVNFGNGETIRLIGVTPNNLTADNFSGI